MAIFGPIDTGRSVLLQGPSAGQESGSLLIEGDRSLIFARGGKAQTRTVVCNVQAPTAIGGAADHTRAATAYVVQQLREMANNPSWNPVFIQWSSGDGVLTPNPFDGWYRLDSVTPLDWSWERHVPCQVTATFVAPPAPRSMAMAYAGGALASNFSGGSTNLVALPVGSTALETPLAQTRTGAEGLIPQIINPVASPEPFVASLTIANLFRGGVHVYDTLNTGTNPVPTSAGTFVHANWVEVFGADHDFVGDCVVTNGLILVLFVIGQSPVGYLWNTALAVANWQAAWTLFALDNSFNGAAIKSYNLMRVGSTECALQYMAASPAAVVQIGFRLQAGRYEARFKPASLTQVPNNGFQLELAAFQNYKIAYDGQGARDAVVESNTGIPTDTIYGYGAFFGLVAGYPIIGFLYQNQPVSGNTGQPFITGGPSAIALGDAVTALRVPREYGVFAIPFGVNGVYSTANLQAEAESGSLAGGWVSVVDAAASNGHAAKLPSGTALGANQTNASWVPPAGSYRCAVRVKVTSAASGVAQMTLGLYNQTVGAFSAASAAGLAPSGFATGYLWYLVGGVVNANGTDSFEFDSFSTAAATTDWFVDEYALLPESLFADVRGPQDLAVQFQYDRDTELIVL